MFNSTYYYELSHQTAFEWGGVNYLQKRTIIHIICTTMSLLSLIGSGYIVCDMICRGRRNLKSKLKKTFNQLLLGLSVADIISSFALCFSVWAFPSDGIDATTFFWASAGTVNTCTAQGFLVTVGFAASAIFTAFISIQYVLIVRYRFRNRTLKKITPFFSAFAITVSFAMGIFYLLAFGFVPAGNFCFLSPYPYFCDWADAERMDECILRGVPNSKNVGAITHSIFTIIVLLIIISCMIIIFITVRRQEQRSSRWSTCTEERSRSKYIAKRAYMYIAAYLFANLPVIFVNAFGNHWVSGLIVVVSLPLQGLLNAMIYSKCIK